MRLWSPSRPAASDVLAFPVHEKEDIITQVRRFLRDLNKASETTPRSFQQACDPSDNTLRLRRWRPWPMTRIRKGPRVRPAAIRQLRLVENLPASVLSTLDITQLVPNRCHASSGFAYPDWLKDYGINEEDWNTFTRQLCTAGSLTRNQIVCVATVVVLNEVLAALAGAYIWPIAAKWIAAGFMLECPLYFYFKDRNLRRRFWDGTTPAWTAFWNLTFFGPKGLVVGFDLPGPVFEDAAVAPKTRTTSLGRVYRGTYKDKAMSTSRAARRARITIVRVHDPMPDAGRRPRIEPMEVSRIQRVFYRLRDKRSAYLVRTERKAKEKMEFVRQQRKEAKSRAKQASALLESLEASLRNFSASMLDVARRADPVLELRRSENAGGMPISRDDECFANGNAGSDTVGDAGSGSVVDAESPVANAGSSSVANDEFPSVADAGSSPFANGPFPLKKPEVDSSLHKHHSAFVMAFKQAVREGWQTRLPGKSKKAVDGRIALAQEHEEMSAA